MNQERLEAWLRLVRIRLPFDRKLDIAVRLASPDAPLPVAPCDVLDGAERRLFENAVLARAAAADLAYLSANGIEVVTLGCPAYPPALRQIARPPLALFVRGAVDSLVRPQLAVVGSRHASHLGLETAQDFASQLSRAGLVITSGLARGIDGAAHRGGLNAGGCTVAVAATGPDRVYPALHADLAARIVEAGGAVVTEFPPGEPPRARNFPRRNRIISGLSLGTLVVEAALRSGSLITARFALEQNREVFAVPGSIHNPAARGCHHLIRQGAKLVEQVNDILEELPVAPAPTAADRSAGGKPPPAQRADVGERVLAAVDFGPTRFDDVVRRTGFGAAAVSAALLDLELRGLVCKSAGLFSRNTPAGD